MKLYYIFPLLIGCTSQIATAPIPVQHDCIKIEKICTDFYGNEFINSVEWAASEWADIGGRQLIISDYQSSCPFNITCFKYANKEKGGIASPWHISVALKEHFVFKDKECTENGWLLPMVLLHEFGHFNGLSHSDNIMKSNIPKCRTLSLPEHAFQ